MCNLTNKHSKQNKNRFIGTENNLVVSREERGRRLGEIDEMDQEVQTSSCKIHKLWEYKVQHRNIVNNIVTNLYGDRRLLDLLW